jgi:hypothetical protein
MRLDLRLLVEATLTSSELPFLPNRLLVDLAEATLTSSEFFLPNSRLDLYFNLAMLDFRGMDVVQYMSGVEAYVSFVRVSSAV